MRSSVTERWRSASLGKPTLPPDLGVTGRLRRAGLRGLNALLPPCCAACDAPVEQQGQLCAACFAQTNFISAPVCARCGVPFSSTEQGGPDALCPGCRDNPPLFRQARAALRYDKDGRRLILPLKHADRVELAPILAGMMARSGAELLARADILVPVPLHRKRLFHRKYNQAAILAFMIGRLTRLPVQPDALQRLRETAPLEEKSPEERAREVSGALQVRPSRLKRIVGKTVLLIDDVMTSGATANACAQALTQAGALAVDVLVAARVPDPQLA